MTSLNGSTSSAIVDSQTKYASLGDVGHYVVIANTILYAFCVVKFMQNEPSDDPIFDVYWKEHGFCNTNWNVPYMSSHDMCLYYDGIAALILIIIYWVNRKADGMENTNNIFKTASFGVLAHGMGHGMVGLSIRKKLAGEEEISELDSVEDEWKTYFVYFLFWIGLLYSSMPNVPIELTGLLAVAVQYLQRSTPRIFGFTYVQTVLLMAFAINQLVRPKVEKDFHYALYPWIVGLPVLAAGWIESTFCSKFVKDNLYGHLIYDGSIPISVACWYFICLRNYGKHAATTSKNKVE